MLAVRRCDREGASRAQSRTQPDGLPPDLLLEKTIAETRGALRTSADQLRVLAGRAVSYDPATPTAGQMEDDIWIMWIGSLSDDDSDILELECPGEIARSAR